MSDTGEQGDWCIGELVRADWDESVTGTVLDVRDGEIQVSHGEDAYWVADDEWRRAAGRVG